MNKHVIEIINIITKLKYSRIQLKKMIFKLWINMKLR